MLCNISLEKTDSQQLRSHQRNTAILVMEGLNRRCSRRKCRKITTTEMKVILYLQQPTVKSLVLPLYIYIYAHTTRNLPTSTRKYSRSTVLTKEKGKSMSASMKDKTSMKEGKEGLHHVIVTFCSIGFPDTVTGGAEKLMKTYSEVIS